jgi:hypothetical protein
MTSIPSRTRLNAVPNVPTESGSRLHRGQREGADGGADTDRSEQNAVKLRATAI